GGGWRSPGRRGPPARARCRARPRGSRARSGPARWRRKPGRPDRRGGPRGGGRRERGARAGMMAERIGTAKLGEIAHPATSRGLVFHIAEPWSPSINLRRIFAWRLVLPDDTIIWSIRLEWPLRR